MQRGTILIISGIILFFACILGLDAIVQYGNTLMPYDSWIIPLAPGESLSRGFDILSDDSEIIFFVDYEPRGVPMNLVIMDADEKTVFEKDFNDYFLKDSFNPDSFSYYVATIKNIGNEDVEVWDIGFQKLPLKTDESGNPILPSQEWYTLILVLLVFIGIIIAIIGGIFLIKDRRKKSTRYEQ